MTDERIELEYQIASRWRRFAGILIDLALSFLLTLTLGIGFVSLFSSLPGYVDGMSYMEETELRSGLYVRDEGVPTRITDVYLPEENFGESDYARLNATFDTALVDFFSDAYFFPEGDGLEIYEDAKYGNDAVLYNLDGSTTYYWTYAEGGALVPRYDETVMYGFYVDCIETVAVPYISTLEAYIDASRIVFWSMLGAVLLSLFISLCVVFLIPPMFFKRGRQTLGLRLMKIGILTSDAVPPSWKRTLARGLILVLVEFMLSLFSFFIPFLVSFTMAMVRKDKQAFHDYMTGTYLVDVSETPVYLSKQEYLGEITRKTPLDLTKSEEEEPK